MISSLCVFEIWLVRLIVNVAIEIVSIVNGVDDWYRSSLGCFSVLKIMFQSRHNLWCSIETQTDTSGGFLLKMQVQPPSIAFKRQVPYLSLCTWEHRPWFEPRDLHSLEVESHSRNSTQLSCLLLHRFGKKPDGDLRKFHHYTTLFQKLQSPPFLFTSSSHDTQWERYASTSITELLIANLSGALKAKTRIF